MCRIRHGTLLLRTNHSCSLITSPQRPERLPARIPLFDGTGAGFYVQIFSATGAKSPATLRTEELQRDRQHGGLPHVLSDIQRSGSRCDCLEFGRINSLELTTLGDVEHPVRSLYGQGELPGTPVAREITLSTDRPPEDHLSAGLLQRHGSLHIPMEGLSQPNLLNGSRKLILVKTLGEAPNLYLHRGLTL